MKKMFLKIWQNLQEKSFAGVSFLTNLQTQKHPPEVFLKIEQNSQENTFAKTLAQVFSCELCKILKSTLFTKHLWTTTS